MSQPKNVLVISMPFAGTAIPSIQLAILESYLKQRNMNISTRHLYLKAAEIYGLNNYNYLIYSPNDSYTAQIIFTKFVFPKHWEKAKDEIKKYFESGVEKNKEIQKTFTFNDYIKKTDEFYNWIIENIRWKDFDIIGFSLNYGQLLPSLSIAKKIKERFPDKKIIFGGSRTTGIPGIKILEKFDYVDFIVSGDGEEALYKLASDYNNYKNIPRLMYKDSGEVFYNESEAVVDLNDLPILNYDSFFEELNSCSIELRQYFAFFGRIPIEISRGCWWNQCSFCNLNVQHKKYRERNVEEIIKEIKILSDKYESISFQIIGNTLPKSNYLELLKRIKEIGRDFTFFCEARAGQLKSHEFTLLKEAGFTILQIGIEAFSQNYLKKINKGAKVIDNIASLKYCKENRITLRYNIIVNYPDEEKIDFEETIENIKHIKQYTDPPQLSYLTVGYGCPIYNNPDKFNIETLVYSDIDKMMYPKEFLEGGFNCLFNFKRKKEMTGGKNDWKGLVDDWRREREKLISIGTERQTALDRLIFYWADGEKFLKIFDKRRSDNFKVYILSELERKIFLACINVISLSKLQEKFPEISKEKIVDVLDNFEKNGIVFREEEFYLSLPLNYELSK